MNNHELKKACDKLTYAEQTLSMVTSGDIKTTKPLAVAAREIHDAQALILKVSEDINTYHKVQIEGLLIKIQALIDAAICLDEEDEEILQLDILNKISDIVSEKLKPTIFN